MSPQDAPQWTKASSSGLAPETHVRVYPYLDLAAARTSSSSIWSIGPGKGVRHRKYSARCVLHMRPPLHLSTHQPASQPASATLLARCSPERLLNGVSTACRPVYDHPFDVSVIIITCLGSGALVPFASSPLLRGQGVRNSPTIPTCWLDERTNPERCSSKRSAQGQGYALRRSVSSMKRLLPLVLSPSTTSLSTPPSTTTTTTTATTTTLAAKMATIEEPATECSFPELLARDLEVSEAIFTSKSMTAGCPSLGLATPHGEGNSYPFRRELEKARQPTLSVFSEPVIGSHHRHSLAMDIRRNPSVATFGHDESRCAGEILDSASESSAGMEPLPVRMREQSFTTAATSVSGRCSSLLSRKPVSPASLASSKMDRSQEGTWFDGEGDGDGEFDSHTRPDTANNSGASHIMAAPPSRRRANSVFNALETRDMFHTPSNNTNSRPATVYISHRPPALTTTTEERPHTSSGPPRRMERPRLIEIQPALAVPKRKSSLKKILCEELPLSTSTAPAAPSAPASPLRFVTSSASNGPPNEEHDFRYHGGPLTSHPPMTLLATSCGRTVIDASKPSSFESDDPDRLRHRLSIAGSFHMGGAGSFSGLIVDDEEPEEPPRQQEQQQPERMRNLSMGTIGSWADSNAEVFAPRVTSNAPVISAPGIPLPPEVVETLRISIACFPETMLLSSSLSIETIRTYSKKVKHRTTPNHQHRLSEDNYPSSYSSRPASRWGFPKLIHARRAKQNSSQSAASLAGIAEMSGAIPRGAPMTPNWTPIKNIFSTGSDYLCDALYAHIIAYNYISALCPPATTSSSMRLVPGSSDSDGPYNPEDKAGPEIPKKAASILGLQASAPAHSSAVNPLLRRIHSRRMGGRNSVAGSNHEMATLRDVQAGLGRCIAFLVATLKQTGSEPRPLDGRLRMVQAREAEAMDPLLLRSLCEVVRCSEAAIC
ncbi:hypothetical protein B0T16DRAFT_385434 [Cercophora newfieldiana]|uniref:Uncharacterized protein n=1 Tax=Cercophora newfieldiana TaxID=92897 RepID=A0AA39YRI6_9PEZI|nr:hypothetical protein B0T16DRAFT_385434 [Cercophora newfieldiana]